MKVVLKPIQIIFTIYAFLLFCILFLLFMPLFVIASFMGRIKGGNLIYSLVRILVDIWLVLTGIFTRTMHESKNTEKRPCIFVANHSSYMDAVMLMKSIREPLRVLAKIEMAKIPLFGYVYKYAAVTVDRSDSENRAKSVAILKSVLQKGISIFIFPEGTFNRTGQPLKSFYDGAFRIAIETQTPIQPLLFLDASKRLDSSSLFTFNPGISRTVYLDMIDVTGLTQDDLPALKEKVYNIMEKELKRFNAY